MVKCWEAWPWKLLGLFTDNARATAQELFDAPAWQLDAGFSRKLRDLAGSPEELLSSKWSGFIHQCFQRLLLSNAFVEDMFAHMSQWLRPVSRPMKHHLLQAKSCLATWSWATVAKRKRANRPHTFHAKRRARPAWAKQMRARRNSCHLLFGQALRREKARGEQHDNAWTAAHAFARAATAQQKLQARSQPLLFTKTVATLILNCAK